MSNSKIIGIISAIVAMMIGFSTFSVEAKTKRALLVGVSDYGNPRENPGEWKNIHGANDIAMLSPLFKNQGFSVTTLVNKQATYANITDALKKVVKDAKKGDLVYLHFSMHGQPFEDLNGDEEDGWDEALIPVDAQMHYKKGIYEGKNHLLDDELEVYFNKIRHKLGPKGKLIVILDACHSGTAARGDEDDVRGTREGFTRSGKKYTPKMERYPNDNLTLATVKGQSPIVCIEACRSYEDNSEYFDKATRAKYGSLSFYVANAIKDNLQIGSEAWVSAVKNGMKNSDNKNVKTQHVVIEKSK